MSTQHIETRRQLRDKPLVADFESVMARCMISDEDKEMLRLHYIHGKDFRWIGDHLGYTERAIKARHKSALRKISYAL